MLKLSGKKRAYAIYVAVVSLLLAVCTVFLCTCFTFVGKLGDGLLCYKYARSLDLSGRGVTCLDGIENVENLERLDVRGADMPVGQIEYVRTVLPECKVLWSAQIGSQLISSDQTSLVCADIEPEQFAALAAMTQLESVDLRGSDHYAQICELAQRLPECEVLYDVSVGGVRYASDTAEVAISDAAAQDVENLAYLTGLKSADLRGCRDYEGILSVYEKLPDCAVVWDGELAGVSFSSEQTLLDLSGISVGSYEEFSKAAGIVKYFPKLEKIDMCYCGLSDEEMDALNKTYPDVKFVWMVHIGRLKTWDIRTDITCFSSLMYGPSYGANQDYFEPLFRYCTDLVALDLGHNQINDISLITNLKKLQILILTDNDIVDISPLAELKNLEFLEINMNEIENLDALSELDNLKYAHFHWNNITDATGILGQTQLVRVLLSQNDLTRQQRSELVEAMPDTTFVYVSTVETRTVWSELPIRVAAKEAFTNWESVENFISWDNVIYK